jgi:hypothetical protein
VRHLNLYTASRPDPPVEKSGSEGRIVAAREADRDPALTQHTFRVSPGCFCGTAVDSHSPIRPHRSDGSWTAAGWRRL